MTIKFKEIKIKISFFFALAITILGFFDKSNSLILCLLSGILHETGHLICLVIFGEKPKEIDITPFGIRIERNLSSLLNFRKEAICAFAGPLINLVIAFIFTLINKKIFSQWITINLSVAVLNLLPCEPLDGEKILENLLKTRLTQKTSEIISLIVSCITVLPVAVLGFIILFKSRYNFSLLIISFYIIFFIALKKKNIPS